MGFSETILEARGKETPEALLLHLPYAQVLGIGLCTREGSLVTRMELRQRLIGDIGVGALHGGAIGSLLECTATLALLWQVECTKMPEVLSLSIVNHSAARPETTFGSASIAHRGRQVATVLVTAWQKQQSEPISSASVILRFSR